MCDEYKRQLGERRGELYVLTSFDCLCYQQKGESQCENEENLFAELESLKEAYDLQRNAALAQQNDLTVQIACCETKNKGLRQKVDELEARLEELVGQGESQKQFMNFQMSELNDIIDQDKEILTSQIEKYQQLNLQLEQENYELTTSYERDKALWEGKSKFFQQQKDQAKADFVSAMEKFQRTMQLIIKTRATEKKFVEKQLQQQLSKAEERSH